MPRDADKAGEDADEVEIPEDDLDVNVEGGLYTATAAVPESDPARQIVMEGGV